MTLKAVRDTVIVKIEYATKIGNIVVPDGAKQYHGDFTGIVVSVGPDYPYELKEGDRLYFTRHEGHKIRSKGEWYLSLREKWCLAKEVE